MASLGWKGLNKRNECIENEEIGGMKFMTEVTGESRKYLLKLLFVPYEPHMKIKRSEVGTSRVESGISTPLRHRAAFMIT